MITINYLNFMILIYKFKLCNFNQINTLYQKIIKSNIITRSNLIERYLKWKQIQHSQNSSELTSLFQGHFLIQLLCLDCNNESFAFQQFGELPLDLLNLEKNIKIRAMFIKIFGKKMLKKDLSNKNKETPKKENLNHKNISAIHQRRKTLNINPKLHEKIKKTHGTTSSINIRGKSFTPMKFSKINIESDKSIDQANSRDSISIFSDKKTKKKYVRIGSQEFKTPKKKKTKTILFNPYRKNPYPDIFLTDLIKDFFEPDYVKDYYCSFCRKKCTIKKSIYILQEPEILQVSLKRFIYHPKKMKIHRPIFIYKDQIDLKDYLFSPEKFLQIDSDLQDSRVHSRKNINTDMTYNNSFSFNQSISQRSTLYDMKSYVEHIGNLSNGHYVCFTKNDVIQSKMKVRNPEIEEEWFFINDKKIYRVEDHHRKLLMYNPSVYSIFYKRIRNNL